MKSAATAGQTWLWAMNDESQDVEPDRAARFLERVAKEALPRIIGATVPFYAIQNDQVKRDRSGVLLRIGDEYFILTASHNLKAIVESQIHLYVGWDEDEKIPVRIPDAIFHTTEEDSRDVAAIKLSKEAAKRILTTKRAISMRDIRVEPERSPGMFFICGFPQAWTSVSSEEIVSKPLPFITRFFRGETSPNASIKYDPVIHALFDFNRNAIGADKLENVVLPSFQGIRGISGCGVWRVVDWDADSVDSWNADDCKLVAIQHRYFEREKYVHTTWIKFALSRIADDYPEMQAAMNIVYP